MRHWLTVQLSIFALLHLSIGTVYARVDAGQCVNGLTQVQIDRLYEMKIQEGRIQEMCRDGALQPSKLNDLIFPHQGPTIEQINDCVAKVSDAYKDFDEVLRSVKLAGLASEVARLKARFVIKDASDADD